MNHTPGAVMPLDPEMVQVGDAVGQRAQWRGLLEGSVRPVGIVKVLVLPQHDHQVPLVPDQGSVQQLTSAVADPPLHDRIHPRRLNRGADNPDASGLEYGVERGGEAGVSVMQHELQPVPRPTDGDDNFCFPGSEALLVHVNGCTDTNTGFDGVSYQRVWPDGNTAVHPQPWLFSSPLTGQNYNVNYTRVALEADLPAIETNTCNRTTGAGCTLIPTTDDGQPAAFYPFFSTLHGNGQGHGCLWAFGNDLPGGNDLGRNAQYGSLLTSTYLAFGGGGATVNRINNFRNIISNPCRA
jgi:hypothetical protein